MCIYFCRPRRTLTTMATTRRHSPTGKTRSKGRRDRDLVEKPNAIDRLQERCDNATPSRGSNKPSSCLLGYPEDGLAENGFGEKAMIDARRLDERSPT